jgi:peptidoglycan/xylan/chitin deacetylase (PgdA/CDA1 family)
MLDRKGVKASFFVNGQNQGDITQARWANVVRTAAARGHCIGSHTWSHRSLGNIDTAGIRREMLDLESLLNTILGKRVRYMRPPYGDLSTFSRNWLTDNGYDIVMWNVDGTFFTTILTSQKVGIGTKRKAWKPSFKIKPRAFSKATDPLCLTTTSMHVLFINWSSAKLILPAARD